VRRGGFWAKHMGLKSGAIGNIFGGHIENLGNNLEKWEKHISNSKNKKKPFPPLPPYPKLKR
jgi:hypothetical protein